MSLVPLPPHPRQRAACGLFGTWLVLVTATFSAGCSMEESAPSPGQAALMTGGNPGAGRELIRAYGCDACHTIPGIPGANRRVGPSLAGISSRLYIAGLLPNDTENLVRWIRDPPAIDSLTAMPALGVSETEARNIAAYLYTLD